MEDCCVAEERSKNQIDFASLLFHFFDRRKLCRRDVLMGREVSMAWWWGLFDEVGAWYFGFDGGSGMLVGAVMVDILSGAGAGIGWAG